MSVSYKFLKELVSAHEASLKFQELRKALLQQVPVGSTQSFRVDNYNVTVNKGLVSAVLIVRAQGVTPQPEPKCYDSCIPRPEMYGTHSKPADGLRPETYGAPGDGYAYLPAVGSYFRVELKRGDRSYYDTLFQCKSNANGAVVGKALNDFWKDREPRIFLIKETNFFDAKVAAEALGLTQVKTERLEPRERQAITQALDALSGSFSWYGSPQGRDYWVDVVNKLRAPLGLPLVKD